MNVPPGQPPWRSVPRTTTRPGTGFSKKKSGAGCAVVAIGVFALVCVTLAAVALVFFLKGRRGAVEDAPARTRPSPSQTATPPSASEPRLFRTPVKRN